METSNIISALSALAQESRLKIFRALVQAGQQGLSAGKIAETVGLAPSSISFHMKELTQADMVQSRHESRYVIYTANFVTMRNLIEFLTDNCCGGQACEVTCK